MDDPERCCEVQVLLSASCSEDTRSALTILSPGATTSGLIRPSSVKVSPTNVRNRELQKQEKKPKKSAFRKGATYLVDLLSSIKRVQFNYSENNGKVIPGYLPNVGFMGTLDPSFGFTFVGLNHLLLCTS